MTPDDNANVRLLSVVMLVVAVAIIGAVAITIFAPGDDKVLPVLGLGITTLIGAVAYYVRRLDLRMQIATGVVAQNTEAAKDNAREAKIAVDEAHDQVREIHTLVNGERDSMNARLKSKDEELQRIRAELFDMVKQAAIDREHALQTQVALERKVDALLDALALASLGKSAKDVLEAASPEKPGAKKATRKRP